MFGVRGALVLLSILPAAAFGQGRQAATFTGAVVWLDFAGDDFAGMSPALGFELQVRYNPTLGRGVSAAGGYHWTRHSVSGPVLRVEGLFFEPRYSFAADSSDVVPYVAGRYSHLMLRGPAAYVTGMSFGAGGGILWEVAPRLRIDAAAGVSFLYFPETNYSATAFGTGLMLRVGAVAVF